MAGFVNRENRVPYYQKLFHDGAQKHIRQWNQTPKSRMLLTPYYIMLLTGFTGSMWMMGRQVFGKKTWW